MAQVGTAVFAKQTTSKMPRRPRSRAWCYTYNNYTQARKQEFEELIDNPENHIKYHVFGEEVGANGTPHLQGYIYFENAKTLLGLRRLMGDIHFDIANGDPLDCSNYCKKGEQPHDEWDAMKELGPTWGLNAVVYEGGVLPQAGRRNDISNVREVADEGGMRAVVAGDFGYQACRHAELYLKYAEQPRQRPPQVVWLWGDTGAGKSRMAAILGGDDCYWKGDRSKWFNGYDRHRCVIFDDLDGQWEIGSRDMLLTLLDRYPRWVETKGGSRQFVADRIIITCQDSPETYEFNGRFRPGELVRRITEVRRCTGVAGGNSVPRRVECTWDEERGGFYTADDTLVEDLE